MTIVWHTSILSMGNLRLFTPSIHLRSFEGNYLAAQSMVLEWATLHRVKLRSNWDKARNMVDLETIDPWSDRKVNQS